MDRKPSAPSSGKPKLPPIGAKSASAGAARPRMKPSAAFMSAQRTQGSASGGKASSPQAMFHHNKGEKDNEAVTKKLLQQARQSGQLNLSGRGLIKVPDRVWHIMERDETEDKELTKGFSLDKIGDPEDNWWDFTPLSKLILASNCIKMLPPDIVCLAPTLNILDAHDNQLEALPDEIGQLEHLQKLNLNHNKLQRLNPTFFALENLKHLSLANNGLVELSDDISRLIYLETLDLSHNELKELPPSIGFVSKLKTLDVSKNKLTELPEEISSLYEMTSLEASRNLIAKLPESMATLGKLELLYLGHNRLTRTPQLKDCVHLKELHLNTNRIVEFTAEDIASFPNIQTLDMKENNIKEIPNEIIDLQQLERLDVSSNDLSGLPSVLGGLPKISHLSVDNNPVRTIRRDILRRGTVGLIKYLKMRMTEDELQLLREKGNASPVGGGIARMGTPPPIPDKYSMKQTQSMTITRKELTELPMEAVTNAREAGVTGVDLSRNLFATFPMQLEEIMPHLREIDLSFNKLESVPGPLLGKANALQYLNLCNNRLTDLPEELSKLPFLREIALSNNSFTRMPSCIYACEKLETLIMNDNKMSELEIKGGLDRLTRLATLDVSNNDVRSIPPELGLMTQLRLVSLEGNGFRVPRRDILVKGTEAVLAYLRDKV